MSDPMPDEPTHRTRRLRRAELISLSAALAVFAVVAVLGILVWLRSSGDPGVAAEREPLTPVAVNPIVSPAPTGAAPTVQSPTPVQIPVISPMAESPTWKDIGIGLIPDWPQDRPVSLLLLGLDNRPGERSGRTDAMILMHISPGSRSATLLSIPRDLCVARCQSDPYRINSVWLQEGPDALLNRIGNLLGMHVDYWLTLDFFGFRRLVDFFGGVTVEVESTIHDPNYPNATDTGFEPFYVEAGTHLFDGDQALRYARTRHQDGAFARDRRQQQVIMALKDQILSPHTVIQSPAFLSELGGAFDTNLPLEVVPSLAKLALQVDANRVVQGAIGANDSMAQPVIAESGAYVLVPNIPRVQAYTAELMRSGEELPPPEPKEPEIRLADRQHLEP